MTGIGAVIRCARVPAGSSVMVIGAGGVGLSAIMAARAIGAWPIIAVDIADNKLVTAGELGATHTINSMKTNVPNAVMGITEPGVDFAFDAVGADGTLEIAFQALRPGGEAVAIGLMNIATTCTVDIFSLLLQKKLTGTYGGSVVPKVDIPAAVSLFLDGRLPLDRLVSKEYTLDELGQAFEDLEAGRVTRASSRSHDDRAGVDVTDFEALTIDRQGPMTEITLNRPQLLNRFDAALHAELTIALGEVQDDPGSRVVVLASTGRAFSAGGDFALMRSGHGDPLARRRMVDDGRRLLKTLLDMPQPVLAAVQGPAVGLGATVALACDAVIAARSAWLADTHVAIGLVAGDGGCIVWPQSVGMLMARRHLLTGDRLSAERAPRHRPRRRSGRGASRRPSPRPTDCRSPTPGGPGHEAEPQPGNPAPRQRSSRTGLRPGRGDPRLRGSS